MTIDSIFNALTLAKNVNNAYGRYDVGIYAGNGLYTIHVFTNNMLLPYHGRELLLNYSHSADFPDKHLLGDIISNVY